MDADSQIVEPESAPHVRDDDADDGPPILKLNGASEADARPETAVTELLCFWSAPLRRFERFCRFGDFAPLKSSKIVPTFENLPRL
jgi:hypothetical protein